jgi:predicted  nucleic acid-binding Zn ribbon protein
MEKERELRNRRRVAKRSSKDRNRRRHYLKTKNIQRHKKKKVIYKEYKPKTSILTRIRMIPGDIARLIAKLKCKFGIHKWNLHSGLKGTSKYMCRNCRELSKVTW